ncbi:hypothetical protein FXF53_13625 [Micromonospora sp. WP24]|uniref:hypothetical protein n=1 Tax=Micromonospora sp. WP24 TaxID=2604469 RepID=UPI0011D7A814|nr:hypothetical protein [Micromonospora sp. WP24]TYC00460.1 hypothetical protein FXF53_13625 [Micromonospora sp. WP24]
MEKRYAAAALFLSLGALLTACGSSASHEEQMEYLRTMAQHGVELHAVKSPGSFGDQEECSDAYQQLYDGPNGHDAPHLEDYAETIALLKEGERLFIESCRTGTPSPVTARSEPASPSV